MNNEVGLRACKARRTHQRIGLAALFARIRSGVSSTISPEDAHSRVRAQILRTDLGITDRAQSVLIGGFTALPYASISTPVREKQQENEMEANAPTCMHAVHDTDSRFIQRWE